MFIIIFLNDDYNLELEEETKKNKNLRIELKSSKQFTPIKVIAHA
jgi:hypothetical protein